MKNSRPDILCILIGIFPLPLLIFAGDLAIRFSYFMSSDGTGRRIFILSLLYEILLSFCLLRFITLFKRQEKILSVVFAILLAALQVLVYGHYIYFGVLPNHYSLNYVMDHFQDAYALTAASVRWYHLVIWIGLSLCNAAVILFSLDGIRRVKKKYSLALLIAFTAASVMLSNNVRFHPASYSFSPSTIFTLKYVIQERFFHSQFEIRRGYVRRNFTVKEKPMTVPRYNLLLFIGEGVRRNNLSYYGYRRPTSPFIDSMIAKELIIPFYNDYTNSVSTQYAVPMILSGNFTIEKLNQPYIYDYLKQWTGIRTFFISSQSMIISNINLVYQTLLDTFICQEISGLPQFNDMGANDRSMALVAESYLDRISRNKFFGVIQFNNTHYPYAVSSPEYERITPALPHSLDSYDNTLIEQDDLLRLYFAQLSRRGLLDSTIVVYTSDHAEAFSEHGHSGHLQSLYEEDAAVPLWIYLPSSFPKERKSLLKKNIHRTTSHLDIFPTILDMYGCLDGEKLNLVPAGQSLFHLLPENRSVPIVGMDMIDTRAVVIHPVKVIKTQRDNNARMEMYDLSADPREIDNLWQKRTSQELEQYTRELSKWDSLRTQYSNRPL